VLRPEGGTSKKEKLEMGGWRIFWNAGVGPSDTQQGVLVALESRTFISEGEAKRLVRQLLAEGLAVISLRRPDSQKIVKGRELRDWAYAGHDRD
jgi:hypothetical protein